LVAHVIGRDNLFFRRSSGRFPVIYPYARCEWRPIRAWRFHSGDRRARSHAGATRHESTTLHFPKLATGEPFVRLCVGAERSTGRSVRYGAAWDGLVLDNILIFLVIGLAIGACLVMPAIMLMLMRHKARVELDHYGKYRGSGPA